MSRDQLLRAQMYVRGRLEEITILALLERWVSELEPAIARDSDGNIIGLIPADSVIGTYPFMLRSRD